MKKHLLSCLTALFISLSIISCSNDIDDRIPKKRSTPTPETPATEKEIHITPLTDSAAAPQGGQQRGEDPSDQLSNYTFDQQVIITFSEGNVQVVGTPNITVRKDQAHLSISSAAQNVEYVLSGSASNGSFSLSSAHPYKLTLRNLSLTNENTVISLSNNSKAFVNIPTGTTNVLTNSISYSDNDNTAVLYSLGSLILTGEGNLSLLGQNTSGIVCQSSLRTTLSSQANLSVKVKKDGIRSKTAYIGDGGSLVVDTQENDGLGNAIVVTDGYVIINDGNYTLKAKNNALMASLTQRETDPFITINGGTFSISAWAKGIVSPSIVTFSNAKIDLNSIDTGVYGGKGIYINKGLYDFESTSENALESELLVSLTAGRTFLKSLGTKTPINVPPTGVFEITGGSLLATGGKPEQKAALKEGSQVAFAFFSDFQSNTLLHLREGEREVFTYRTPISFAYLLFTSSKLLPNKKYDFYKEGTIREGEKENNLYKEGYYKAGTHVTYFNTNKTINP